jgi:hypothetical protein
MTKIIDLDKAPNSMAVTYYRDAETILYFNISDYKVTPNESIRWGAFRKP